MSVIDDLVPSNVYNDDEEEKGHDEEEKVYTEERKNMDHEPTYGNNPNVRYEEINIPRPSTGLRRENVRNNFNPFFDIANNLSQESSSEQSNEPSSAQSQSLAHDIPQSQRQRPEEIFNSFFGGIGGIGNIFDGIFIRRPMNRNREQDASNADNTGEADRQQRRNPFGLFGQFDFPIIFNDQEFGNFGSNQFQNAFDPAIFMNNFHSNFRSNRAFQDFINRTMQMQEPASRPAAKEAVEKLPIIEVEEKHCKKEDGKEALEPPSCPVCIDEIPIGKEAMFMPCGHTFHPTCLKPWLKDHNTCPICRKELPTEN